MICFVFLVISTQHIYMLNVWWQPMISWQFSDSFSQDVVVLGSAELHIRVHLVCRKKALASPPLPAMWCI